MNLPEHLRAAIESHECPPDLTPFEKVVWASERRQRYENGDMTPVQPRHTQDLNPTPPEGGRQ